MGRASRSGKLFGTIDFVLYCCCCSFLLRTLLVVVLALVLARFQCVERTSPAPASASPASPAPSVGSFRSKRKRIGTDFAREKHRPCCGCRRRRDPVVVVVFSVVFLLYRRRRRRRHRDECWNRNVQSEEGGRCRWQRFLFVALGAHFRHG